MVDERIKMLEEAMENQEFAEKVANVESEVALKTLFAAEGIVMTDEEVIAFCERVRSMLNSNSDELTEDALEDANGGSLIGGLLFLGACYFAGRIYAYASKKKLGACWN